MATKPILVDLDFASNAKVIGLPTPTASGDAANKAYVDALIGTDTYDVNVQSGTTYTLAIGDNNNQVDLTNTSTKTITMALFATVALADQSFGTIVNKGAGLATFDVPIGVTLNGVAGPASFTFVQNAVVFWYKTGNNIVETRVQLPSGTDLTYTASTRLLESNTGTDVILPLADANNPGLASAADEGPDRYSTFHDCISATGDGEWTVVVSGTASAFSSVTPPDNSLGWVRWVMGTVATNRGAFHSPNFAIMRFGLGRALWKNRLRIVTLSDATNRYAIRSGFIDNVAGESVDGAFFRYTDNVNGGRFECVTRSNNVETAVDSTITVAINTTYKLEIDANAAGTSIEFRIDGTLRATITTNIPTGAGRETGYGLMGLRSLGTASINAFDMDYVKVEQRFTGR
jgi:hypothetical protein